MSVQNIVENVNPLTQPSLNTTKVIMHVLDIAKTIINTKNTTLSEHF